MNEIIKIDSDNKVSGRELHDWLEVSEKFSDWMKRMIEYGFTAGIDFDSFSEKSDKPTGGRPSVGYNITINMAKEICMIQRTEKGKQARQYFIECERRLKLASIPHDSYMISDPVQRAKKWIEEEQERQRLASSVKELTPKAKVYDEFVDIDHTIGFRELAKELNVSEAKLRETLDDDGWQYKAGRGKRKPYKWVITEGYMKAVDVKNGEWSGVRYRFTMKGRDEVTKMMEVGQ